MDPEQNEKDSILDLETEPESPLTLAIDLQQLNGHERTLQEREERRFPPPSDFLGDLGEQRNRPMPLEHRIPTMTEDVARNALVSFVNSKCCYGNKAAGELVIQDLRQLTLYRYRLETFNESRLSEWTFEPLTSNLVDGPQNGTSPRPWDIKVQTPPLFQDDTRKFRIPHSSLVKACHKCHGHGRYKCSGCQGAGWMRCVSCSGTRQRRKQQRRCQMCSGTGRKRCSTCSGRGNKTCMTCQGERKLLHFKQLIITWKNNVFEFVSEHQLDFPGELLSKVNGENVFRDENVLVYPIIDFPKPEISLASQRAIAEHNAAFTASSRILQQNKRSLQARSGGKIQQSRQDKYSSPLKALSRQTIELIPITEVHYQYAGKTYLYFIYGLENKVYTLDYPERYCCGCTII
ncbi:protein SSUH2 homolog isoform X1 [Alligator mississippiensis]|uniref:protein SSUH2 homolog isoform X1 n=2 Tax=Alligator mississippiensis TaxID=8496 RepID=UPI002877C43D|nr:protein SSUH2 homolog isoform X1 [Alligator mississippiensis]